MEEADLAAFSRTGEHRALIVGQQGAEVNDLQGQAFLFELRASPYTGGTAGE
jgi:hypothetical protein